MASAKNLCHQRDLWLPLHSALCTAFIPPMKSLKTLAFLTAGFAYALIVLGAVVRITESGMGCGDHWPLCNGQLIPSFADYHTIIEYAHRIAALGLFAL